MKKKYVFYAILSLLLITLTYLLTTKHIVIINKPTNTKVIANNLVANETVVLNNKFNIISKNDFSMKLVQNGEVRDHRLLQPQLLPYSSITFKLQEASRKLELVGRQKHNGLVKFSDGYIYIDSFTNALYYVNNKKWQNISKKVLVSPTNSVVHKPINSNSKIIKLISLNKDKVAILTTKQLFVLNRNLEVSSSPLHLNDANNKNNYSFEDTYNFIDATYNKSTATFYLLSLDSSDVFAIKENSLDVVTVVVNNPKKMNKITTTGDFLYLYYNNISFEGDALNALSITHQIKPYVLNLKTKKSKTINDTSISTITPEHNNRYFIKKRFHNTSFLIDGNKRNPIPSSLTSNYSSYCNENMYYIASKQLWKYDSDDSISLVARLPNNFKPYRFDCSNNNLYITDNDGTIYTLSTLNSKTPSSIDSTSDDFIHVKFLKVEDTIVSSVKLTRAPSKSKLWKSNKYTDIIKDKFSDLKHKTVKDLDYSSAYYDQYFIDLDY